MTEMLKMSVVARINNLPWKMVAKVALSHLWLSPRQTAKPSWM